MNLRVRTLGKAHRLGIFQIQKKTKKNLKKSVDKGKGQSYTNKAVASETHETRAQHLENYIVHQITKQASKS